jgi:hypothetical protein
MIRIARPRAYPPHFFTRLHRSGLPFCAFDDFHQLIVLTTQIRDNSDQATLKFKLFFNRLYERLYHSVPAATILSPGLELMAKDLIDDESDLSDTNVDMDCSASDDAKQCDDLPSIEELTR